MSIELKVIEPFEHLQTENLRLTAFFAPGSEKVADQHWWTDLTGSEPETRTSQPGRGVLQEAGAAGERYGLVLSLQLGRADWILVAKQEEGVPPQIKWAGPFSETLPFFSDLMKKWFASAPPISRLAFGAVVHIPTQTREESYQKLAGYLPRVWIDPVNSTDFMYQVNRSRNSSVVEGLRIHRLSKWAASVRALVQLAVTPLVALQTALLEMGQQSCRIEIDINTDPQYARPFSATELSPLLDELIRLGSEIISQGDIA